MRKNIFTRKTYGGIFVRNNQDMVKVRNIIKDIDPFEFDYLKDDFIQVTEPDFSNQMTYGHKFEMDIDEINYRCFLQKIPVICLTDKDEWFNLKDLMKEDKTND